MLNAVEVFYSEKKLLNILDKSGGRCCHCGKELKVEDMEVHDVITFNDDIKDGSSTIVALCKDCSEEYKISGKVNDLDFYGYLLEDEKEIIADSIKQYEKNVEWYLNNKLLPTGDIVKEGYTLADMTSEDNVDMLTKYLEEYNKFVKLALYGEENLMNKIVKDGRVYCLFDENGNIEMMLPIKPLKTPKGCILNFGNIMINPSIGIEDCGKYYKIVKSLVYDATKRGNSPVISEVVVACNSRDERSVDIIKKLSKGDYKVAKIRPGYSLAQTAVVVENDCFKDKALNILGDRLYTSKILKSKDSRIKNLVKDAHKGFDKIVKCYLVSYGGRCYEEYIKARSK